MKEYQEKPKGWVEDKDKAEMMAHAGDPNRSMAKIIGTMAEERASAGTPHSLDDGARLKSVAEEREKGASMEEEKAADLHDFMENYDGDLNEENVKQEIDYIKGHIEELSEAIDIDKDQLRKFEKVLLILKNKKSQQ